jgi:hypothetical protein
MAKQSNKFFSEFIQKLSDAVISANKLSLDQAQDSVKEYFNEDGTPKVTKYQINGKTIEVPTFVLAPHRVMSIKELTISFKAKLTQETEGKSWINELLDGFKHRTPAKANREDDGDVGLSLHSFRSDKAEIKITFEGTDPPEGVMRINDKLIDMI